MTTTPPASAPAPSPGGANGAQVGRIALEPPVHALLAAAAAQRGLTMEDLAEVLVLAELGAGSIAAAARAFLDRTTIAPARTQPQLAAALIDACPGLKAVGVRLGPRVDAPMTAPFARTGHGADFGEQPSSRMFGAVRGLWVVGDDSNAAVAFRAGEALALYLDVRWSQPEGGRRWIVSAVEVTPDSTCIDPVTRAVVRRATTPETVARDVLAGGRLLMPRAARNPILRLW